MGFLYLIYPTYLALKRNKIILEINQTNDNVVIESYSVLTGKKKLNLKLDEIIKLDFYKGFVVRYKSANVKLTETFGINAEPWNNIYGQIKQLN